MKTLLYRGLLAELGTVFIQRMGNESCLKIKLQTTPHTMFGSKHSGVVAVKKANEVDIL